MQVYVVSELAHFVGKLAKRCTIVLTKRKFMKMSQLGSSHPGALVKA